MAKAATAPVAEVILGNLSQGAAEMVQEECDNLGPTPLSEVLAAQAEIVKLIRHMMDRGEIRPPNATEQLV